MMRRLLPALAGLVLLALAQTAAAAPWLQAETDRFIIRGEVSERVIRDYALKLATFDAVLRANYPHATAGRAPQKLNIYLVNGVGEIRAITPKMPATIGGFYAPAIEPFVVVDRTVDDRAAADNFDEIALFHEYAHHFMFAHLPGAIPAWLSEGWAEYFAVTKIDGDKVVVGGNSRGGSLFGFWIPMEDVLSKAPGQLAEDQHNRFYAQSWIFTHYMQATPERTVQLGRMLDLIGQGQSSVAALRLATGMDPALLTQHLRAYRQISALAYPNPMTSPPAITVTRMPKAASDLLFDTLRAPRCRGDQAFLAHVRAEARPQPDNPYAQRLLARTEFGCGDPLAAEAIIDGLLAKDAKDVEALRIGALGLAQAAAAQPAGRGERFAKARALAARGYALSPNDAPLIYAYVLARRVQPGYPTANDVTSIRTAMALAPSVTQITLLGGEVLMRSGQRDEGRALLLEVANNPHGGPQAEIARRLIERNSTDVGDALTEPENASSP